MIDKSGLRHYTSGFSYMIQWCRQNTNIVDRNEKLISEETKETIKKEHQPHLEKLRNYLIEQLRRIQKDESLLKQILKKEKVIKEELSIEERIIAAISEIIINIDRSFNLLKQKGWSFLMSEFITYLVAAERGLHDLKFATNKLGELVNQESTELNAEFPEHQDEIKRILLEL